MARPKVTSDRSGGDDPRGDEERLKAQVGRAEAQIVEQSKKIDFNVVEYTIELLADKMGRDDFFIPGYQREDVWDDNRKSRFIESLLMGLPIPFLFFWEQPETGKLEIVDGAQRLRTINQYIHGDFRVGPGPLTTLTDLVGLCFADLPDSRRRKLKNRSIRGIILNEHADDTSRNELFDRINTGSKTPSPAEIRRGSLGGPFQSVVVELAENLLFVKLTPHSEQQEKEKVREELVARFFAYGDALDDYKDNPSRFLYDYVKTMNASFSSNPKLEGRYRREFADAMEFVERVFPYGFARSKDGGATPRTRFEAIAVGVRLAIKQKPALKKRDVDATTWLESEEFRKIVRSDGANVKRKLVGRLHFVRDKLLGEGK